MWEYRHSHYISIFINLLLAVIFVCICVCVCVCVCVCLCVTRAGKWVIGFRPYSGLFVCIQKHRSTGQLQLFSLELKFHSLDC